MLHFFMTSAPHTLRPRAMKGQLSSHAAQQHPLAARYSTATGLLMLLAILLAALTTPLYAPSPSTHSHSPTFISRYTSPTTKMTEYLFEGAEHTTSLA